MSAAVDLAALVGARRQAKERLRLAKWRADLAASEHARHPERAEHVAEEATARAEVTATEEEVTTLTTAIVAELERIATVQLQAERRMRAEVEADPTLASGDSAAHRRLRAVGEAAPDGVTFTIHHDWEDSELPVVRVDVTFTDGDVGSAKHNTSTSSR